MTQIITVHGYHFAIDRQGFRGAAAEADADAAISAAVNSLKALSSVEAAQAYAEEMAFQAGERDSRSKTIEAIESAADIQATIDWHDPNAAYISIFAWGQQ